MHSLKHLTPVRPASQQSENTHPPTHPPTHRVVVDVVDEVVLLCQQALGDEVIEVLELQVGEVGGLQGTGRYMGSGGGVFRASMIEDIGVRELGRRGFKSNERKAENGCVASEAKFLELVFSLHGELLGELGKCLVIRQHYILHRMRRILLYPTQSAPHATPAPPPPHPKRPACNPGPSTPHPPEPATSA
jgi:hypothetical protein